MKPIQIISQDLFDKIRSRFQNLEMGDESGTVTIDPAEAKFFDFDFVIENINLGRVSININDLGSLKIYYSQGITEGKDDLSKKIWYDFLKEMRTFAMRRLLRFDTRDISKENLDKNDFQYLATKGPKEEETMTSTMNESRWMLEKSSKKTSRAVKGRTQVIVRHFESMAERRVGERSNPKRIKAIYIENAEGERFKYPFIHPAGAFAMAQHVDHGGIPHDPAGKAIIKMSEDIAQLQEFRRQVQRSTLNDDATGITERAIGRLNELKVRVEALGKRHHYESWIAEFNETEHNDEVLSELDPVQFEEYKSKFTHSSFNEELGKLFPLIHSIMQEKIDLEEYVNESNNNNQQVPQEMMLNDKPIDPSSLKVDGIDRRDHPKYVDAYFSDAKYSDGTPLSDAELDQLTNMYGDKVYQMAFNASNDDNGNEFAQFEQWAEAVESGKLNLDVLKNNIKDQLGSGDDITPQQIQQEFTTQLSNIKLGADGVDAWGKLTELFGFDERDSDDKELQDRLYDTAQNSDVDKTGINSPVVTVFKNWIEEKFPDQQQELAELAPEIFGGQSVEPVAQPAPEQPVAQPAPEQPVAQPAPEQPVAEDKQGSMIEEIAKLVNSRFNRSNPRVGPFNGHEGILIDVEKTISEKFGEEKAEKARLIADSYMKKLTQEWQQRHGNKIMGEKDDLQRLKELVSNLKSKLEEKDQPANEAKDSVSFWKKQAELAGGPDVDNILAELEKEIYYKKLKGNDALYYLRVQLLDLALNQVGRDKREGYEPHVMNVKNWDDAKEFLTVAFRDAREQGAVEQTKALPEMESILKLAGLIK